LLELPLDVRSSPERSPMTIAVAIPADHALHRPTPARIARRSKVLKLAAASAMG
jgi:hypothetical protein